MSYPRDFISLVTGLTSSDLTFDKIIEGYEASGISKDEIVHELKEPETSAELTTAVNTYVNELNDSIVDNDANYAWDNIGVMKE